MNARPMIMVFVLNAVTFWAAQALAQQSPPKPAPPPASQPTVSIQFPGGSLADYVKTLKEGAPTFNVVMLVPEARDIKLPPIKLDSVAFGPAVGLLTGEHQLGDGVVMVMVNNLGGPLGSDDPGSVYKIWSERRELHRPPAQVRVWNIGELLGPDRKADDVLTAVETAVGLLEGYEPAKIRYHAETTLLVASGEEEQLRAIDRVIAGVQEGSRKKSSEVITKKHLQMALAMLAETKGSADAIAALEALQKAAHDTNTMPTKGKENPASKDGAQKPIAAP